MSFRRLSFYSFFGIPIFILLIFYTFAIYSICLHFCVEFPYYLISVIIGYVVIAKPATELSKNIAAIRMVRSGLAKLSDNDLIAFKKIVRLRELESKFDSDPVREYLKLPPSQARVSTGSWGQIVSTEIALSDFIGFIANDAVWRSIVTPPLMQSSGSSRLRYLRRVWPKDKLSLLNED